MFNLSNQNKAAFIFTLTTISSEKYLKTSSERDFLNIIVCVAPI